MLECVRLFARIIIIGLLLTVSTSISLSKQQYSPNGIDLGDIPDRPRAPEFPLEQLFSTHEIFNLKFAPNGQKV